LTILNTVDGLPESEWDTEGVCGVWSVKEIMAHLTSYEQVLIEVLNSFLDGGPTPNLTRMTTDPQKFNDEEVGSRRTRPHIDVLAEYTNLCTQAMALVAKIPVESWRQTGALPWYGPAYDLEDYIIYTFYGHKREHSAQIAFFRDRVG
jgi:hypothetical protein